MFSSIIKRYLRLYHVIFIYLLISITYARISNYEMINSNKKFSNNNNQEPSLNKPIDFPISYMTNFSFNCLVASGHDLKIFVKCPFLKNQICYHDCLVISKCSKNQEEDVNSESFCVPEGDSTHCNVEKFINGSKLITIHLDQSDKRIAGAWSCMHNGQQSKEINIYLNEVIRFIEVKVTDPPKNEETEDQLSTDNFNYKTVNIEENTTLTPTKTFVNQEKKEEIILDVSNDSITLSEALIFNKNNSSMKEKSWRLITSLMEPEALLVIIILLIVSLIFNVIFCVRCTLLKCYFSSKRRKSSATDCISSALCMPPEEPNYYKNNVQNPTLISANPITQGGSSMHVPLLSSSDERFPNSNSAYVIATTQPLSCNQPLRILHEPFYATALSRNRASHFTSPTLMLPQTMHEHQNRYIHDMIQNIYPTGLHGSNEPETLPSFRQASIYDEVASTTNTILSTPRRNDCLVNLDEFAPFYGQERAIDPVVDIGFVTGTLLNRNFSEESECSAPAYNAGVRCKTPSNLDQRISSNLSEEENIENSLMAKRLLDEAGDLLQRAEKEIKNY